VADNGLGVPDKLVPR